MANGARRRGPGRRAALWALALAATLGAALPHPARAEAEPAATAPAAHSPAELYIANRRIVTLRATNDVGNTPAERAAGIPESMELIERHGGPLEVTTAPLPGAVMLLVDGRPLFRVLDGDVDPEVGETLGSVAGQAKANLELAMRDLRDARDANVLLRATGESVLATLTLAVALWLLVKGYRALARRVRGALQARYEKLAPAWGQHVMSQAGWGTLAMMPFKALGWAIGLLLAYQWAALVLGFFPYTRPWGEALWDNLTAALGGFGSKLLGAVPGLLFVLLIFAITRWVVRLVRAFFDGVAAGRIQVGWVDDTTARPTGRLLIALIWLFSLVAAYPYIPGSESEAFKGIGVFVGLMLSIGASGVVNQAVSGLMLMYTRSLRAGEFVQIGETEGTVTLVGFLTTRIETLRNVEVSIPNAVIASSVTRNFSRLAPNGGVRVATSVTIGYDTPWRQVQAMLLLAAARTAQLSPEPPARVLQSALKDFYVEYTLLVTVPDPKLRPRVLDELHGHVQDVFNEFGVQIMSPNYEADPAGPKVVPREQWYAAPADPTAPRESPTAPTVT